MSLSLYRINETFSLQALFIFFATINSIYTCMFDSANTIEYPLALHKLTCGSHLGFSHGLVPL